MNTYFFSFVFFLTTLLSFGQVDNQLRYHSDHRLFYQWDAEKQDYVLKDNEYETSVIDIREINSNRNGYVIISMTDDGTTRLYHGSIKGYSKDETEETWSLRSKILKSKLVYNPKKKQITYSYEANEERYMKIFVFDLTDK